MSYAVAAQTAPFLQLPNDALLEVFTRSNPLPPCTIARTCRLFYSLLQDDATWGVLHQRDFRTIEKEHGKTTFRASYQTLHRIFSNILKGVCLNGFISSEPRPLRVRGLFPPYLTIGQDRLFRGGNGHSIEVWDLKTAQPLNLYGDNPPKAVWHVLPYREELVADDADTVEVFIYDLKTLSSRAFEGPEQCDVIRLHEGKLIGGRTNGSIEIWDLETRTLDQELAGHTSSVNILAMVDGLFISGSVGNHFKVWDWEKKEYLFDFRTDRSQGFSYCTFNHLLILGYGDAGIHVMKINVAEKKAEKIFQLDGGIDPSFATGTIGGIPMLLTIAKDDLVCFWDLDTGVRMKVYSMEDDSPGSIAFYDGKLICSNKDGTISRFDFAADDLSILEDIALEFEQGDQETAALHFSKMPRHVRMKIYDQIVMGLDFCDGGMDGDRPSREEIWEGSPRKAEAIRNYVRIKREEEKEKI